MKLVFPQFKEDIETSHKFLNLYFNKIDDICEIELQCNPNKYRQNLNQFLFLFIAFKFHFSNIC